MEMILACGATPATPSGAPGGSGGTSGSSGAPPGTGSPGPLDGSSGGGGGGGGGGGAGLVSVIVTGEGGGVGAIGGGGPPGGGGAPTGAGATAAAHNVAAARGRRQSGRGVRPGVDDRDGYTVPGRVLPRLADVEQGEARRGDRHIRFGHGDGPRADVALPHRRFRHGLAVRRNPAGINDGWRNRLCCRQTRRHSDQQADESEGGDPQRRQRTHHRMRTQLNSPPIHAASGNAAMIAAISSHSATIRTNGVNLVIGTSRAATKPAAPYPASSSAPHSTASDDAAGACQTYLMTPTQVAAAAPTTSAMACRLSANARPRLMKMRTNSPPSTTA